MTHYILVLLISVVSLPMNALGDSSPASDRGTEFEQRVQEAITTSLPSVVQITAQTPGGLSFGSGFVIDNDKALILTNYHIIANGKDFSLKFRGRSEL